MNDTQWKEWLNASFKELIEDYKELRTKLEKL